MKENGTVRIKDRLIQSVQILIFGLLTVFLLVLLILELIPSKTQNLRVKDPFAVASFAVDASGMKYVSSLHGSFQNDSDEDVLVETVRVTLGNGKKRTEIELEGFALPARCRHDVELNFEGNAAWDSVIHMEAQINGASVALQNMESASPISGALIFYAVLLIPCVWFGVRAAKVRYYLYQESKLCA